MKFYYKTDKGLVRPVNQDQAMIYENKDSQVLGLVLDGMGGHKAGEIASKIALEYILDCFKIMPPFLDVESAKVWVKETIDSCNRLVLKTSKMSESLEGMGTTLALVLIMDHHCIYTNVGDSRIYYYRDGLKQISDDQTLVSQLVKEGAITLDEAKHHPKRHVLLQALGVFDTVQFDVNVFKVNEGTLLLCSDGLYTMVSEEAICLILASGITVSEKVDLLVEEANRGGGHDNISVSLIEMDRKEV